MPATVTSDLLVFDAPGHRAGDDPRKIAYVRVGDIVIDQNVQREVNPAKIDKMGEWDYYLAETPTVVHRDDGTLAAVEGQHRVIKLQQEDPDRHLWVVYLHGQADEAAIAASIAKSRTQHSAYQMWQLELAQGKALQVAAQEVLDNLGLELSNFKRSIPGERRIAAVAAVGQIMRMGADLDEGAQLLDTVLSVIMTAFSDQVDMFASLLIKVVAQLVHRNPGIDTQRLARKLAEQTPARWLQERAHKREGQPALECIGQAVVTEYNRGLHQATRIAW